MGKRSISQRIIFPSYKVLTPNGWMVENFEGKLIREATQEDLKELKSRKSFSPAAIEYAVRAYWGVVEWRDYCEELLLKQRGLQ